MKEKIKKYKVLIIIIVLFFLVSTVGYYFMYMQRVNQTFYPIIDIMKDSLVIKDNFGEVKNVKYNNFLKWISNKNGEECVEVKLITKDNKKYNICVALDKDNHYKSITGYIYNNQKYDETKELEYK